MRRAVTSVVAVALVVLVVALIAGLVWVLIYADPPH